MGQVLDNDGINEPSSLRLLQEERCTELVAGKTYCQAPPSRCTQAKWKFQRGKYTCALSHLATGANSGCN